MSYILVLDDTRSIGDVKFITPAPFESLLPIVLVKDFKEGQLHMIGALSLCAHVCFDHFLFGSPNHMDMTGLDFAHWLVHYDERRKEVLTKDFTFSVHSSDPEGAKAINEKMEFYQTLKRSH